MLQDVPRCSLQVVNATTEAMSGYLEDELFGRNCTMLLPAADREHIAKLLSQVCVVRPQHDTLQQIESRMLEHAYVQHLYQIQAALARLTAGA